VLGAGQAAGEIAGVPRLASLLLLAEANLSAGAESCDAVEGVVRVSHALLSEVDFQLDSTHRPLADNEAALATELSDVLSSHSTGELCR